MKDLTVKLKNIEYAYDVAMKNLTKVAKKKKSLEQLEIVCQFILKT
jgi:hypothetical protein